MPSINRITLCGHIGRDAETRMAGEYTVTTFSMATNDGTKERPRTTWHNVEVWNCKDWQIPQLKKGNTVQVTGRLLCDEWEKDGRKFQRAKISGSIDFVAPVGAFRFEQVASEVSQYEEPIASTNNEDDLPF